MKGSRLSLCVTVLFVWGFYGCAGKGAAPTYEDFRHEATLQEFDLDGDGNFIADELDAMQEFVEKRRKERVEAGQAQVLLIPAPDTPEGDSFRLAAEYSAARNGHAILVMKDGEVVFERYDNGQNPAEPHLLHSATKGFWGPVIAAMIEDGIVSSWDESVADTLTEFKNHPQKSQLTVRHLLTLTGGIAQDLKVLHPMNRSSREVPDLYRAVLDIESEAAPGERFRYGPSDYYVLGAFMKRKLAERGQSPFDYLDERILSPLGIEAGPWVRDPSGNLHIPGRSTMTARNWATYGQWLLDGGAFGGEQIVKRELLAECAKPSRVNPGYAFTFWHNAPGGYGLKPGDTPKPEGKGGWVYPEGEPDLYMSAGGGDNRLYILPSRGMVVVRFGESAGMGYVDREFIALMLEGKGAGVEVGRGSPKGTQERAAEHEAWVEDYLAENDANGDGLIQVAETTGRIRAFFELFDEDADGSLDEGELLGIARRRSSR